MMPSTNAVGTEQPAVYLSRMNVRGTRSGLIMMSESGRAGRLALKSAMAEQSVESEVESLTELAHEHGYVLEILLILKENDNGRRVRLLGDGVVGLLLSRRRESLALTETRDTLVDEVGLLVALNQYIVALRLRFVSCMQLSSMISHGRNSRASGSERLRFRVKMCLRGLRWHPPQLQVAVFPVEMLLASRKQDRGSGGRRTV